MNFILSLEGGFFRDTGLKSPNTKFGASDEMDCKFCTPSNMILVPVQGFALGGIYTIVINSCGNSQGQ